MLNIYLTEMFEPVSDNVEVRAECKLNIARMDLVFDNEDTIKMLRERGLALYDKDLIKVKKIED